MPKLYVANCTPQEHVFSYRLPEQRSVRYQPIPAGEQRLVSGNLTSEDVACIVDQHVAYGACDARSVAQARRHVSLLWSVDREVSVAQMRQALERNLQVMRDEGTQLRQHAAVAISDDFEKRRPDIYKGVDVEVVEEQGENGDAPAMHERLRVERRGGPQSAPPRKRRRAA